MQNLAIFRKFKFFTRSTLLTGALACCALAIASPCRAQQPVSGSAATTTAPAGVPAQAPSATASPLTLTLQDALERAHKNSPEFLAALTATGVAHEGRVQARSVLLPSVDFNTTFLYTQGNGTPSARFIGNNGVHEYVSQGEVHQALFDGSLIALYRRAGAMEALARASQELAERGLAATVTRSYYGLVVAQRKYATSQRGEMEAHDFFTLSQRLEHGGEAAHSDVIKAELQWKQRQRDLQEARLDMERSRLDLAVVLFPQLNLDFAVVDDLSTALPLPTLDEIQALGARNYPQLRAAVASLQAAQQDVIEARSGYLPTIGVSYFYGIDANSFATQTDGIRNLGYSAAATLKLPVWNWGATHSRVKQAVLERNQARTELSFAQRRLLADLQGFYAEADAARGELTALERAAQLSADSLRLTTLRYQAGEVSVLEVVDAQNTLIAARGAYDDGQVRYRTALADLQTLTGNF